MFKDYNILSNAIGLRKVKFISNMLAKHNDIDIMHFDGKFLRLAIGNPNPSPQITKLLLDYFKNVQLAKCQKGSDEYHILESRLKTYLEEAALEEALSQEMMEILSEYINTLGEATSESEVESIHETDITSDSFEQDSDIENKDPRLNNFFNEAEDVGLMYGNLTIVNLNKNYEYIRIARESEKDYKNGLYYKCINKITHSASAIYANRKYSHINKEIKASILYKYLCFYNDDNVDSEVTLDNPWKFIDLKNYAYEMMQNAICDNNYNITKLILDKMPDTVNMADKFGQTLLHWASDNPEITEILLNVHDDLSLPQSSNSTESIIDESNILHDNIKLLGSIDEYSSLENNES